MARNKSREALVKELKVVEAKIAAHDKAERERIGQLAIKAGIGSISISDEELTRELQAIVARFREANPEVAEPKAKGRRGAGQAEAGADDQAA
ncbi:TraC family protein [Methylobacterium sp. J-043]|uniref:TraC family protein n=1 Tax=Methylorubrum TaxID=2282523 RepID=UPI00209FD089|nr:MULTISPECIES: TraC family protein [Methylorubrum]MCJ2029475.1 TraC family protein [Methylobacterium sp. J-043]MCP1551436.1 ribosomal protein L1 [Methylorubrum zatmanii]MCP1556373.1 ribosomal protein L1 [Methylorubrum extorquens]